MMEQTLLSLRASSCSEETGGPACCLAPTCGVLRLGEQRQAGPAEPG